MNIASIDKNTVNFVTRISERAQDVQALIGHSLDQLWKRATSSRINHILGTFQYRPHSKIPEF